MRWREQGKASEGRVEADLSELHAFLLYCPYRLRTPMQERLRHRRLIRALDAPIETKVRRLERHLHERIRREAVRGNEVLAVARKLKGLRGTRVIITFNMLQCVPHT